jgi:hypothetical protein
MYSPASATVPAARTSHYQRPVFPNWLLVRVLLRLVPLLHVSHVLRDRPSQYLHLIS